MRFDGFPCQHRFQRVAFGELSDFLKGLGHHLTDVTPVEALTLAPLAILTIVMGLYPALVLDFINGPVKELVTQLAPVTTGMLP